MTAVSKNKATLPFFFVSAPVMNSMHGKVQKVTGDFTLKMNKSDAEKLAKDPKAKTALANALATSVGLDADDVIITGILIEDAFGKFVKVARRLAAGDLKVEYEILTTSTKVINATTMKASSTALAVAVQKESAAIGVTIPKPVANIAAPKVESVGQNAKCKDALCPSRMVNNPAKNATACTGNVKSCDIATCCMADPAMKCGAAMDVACGAGKFQDPTKGTMARGSDMGKTACCSMRAKCKDFMCGAGLMANTSKAETMCSGANSTCAPSTCCSTKVADPATPPPGTDGAIAMFLPSLSAVIVAAGSLFFL